MDLPHLRLLALGLSLILLVGVAWRLQGWRTRRLAHKPASTQSSSPRPLKPKTAHDCPECRAAQASGETVTAARVTPMPWRLRKGIGGRKKRLATAGYFCPNPACEYYLVSDAAIHALVGYGVHGKHEPIQDLWCQCCRRKFTARRHTVLYRLKTLSRTVAQALTLLVVGMDASAVEEVYGLRESTLRTWLVRAGQHGHKLHQHFLTQLTLTHIQLDELWAPVKHAEPAPWVWVACDAKTKLIPVLQLGPRTQAMAFAVVHELLTRLKPGPLPAFSSDGLRHYFYALTAHCGAWVQATPAHKPIWTLATDFLYAQVIKHRRRQRLISVSPRLVWGQVADYVARLTRAGLRGRINTAFVERINLTLRQGIASLARRTWSTAQLLPDLTAHLDWWLAYYHFSRYHQSLRRPLDQPRPRRGQQTPQRYQRRTPAMAAGLTPHRWSVLQLISYPLG